MVKNIVMIKVNSAEAKAKLSEYLDRALAGERIVICRHNEPVVELRAIESTRVEPRPLGPLPGQPTFEIPPTFFEPLPDDELDLWEGGPSREYPAPDLPRSPAPRVAEGKVGFRGRGKRSRRTS